MGKFSFFFKEFSGISMYVMKCSGKACLGPPLSAGEILSGPSALFGG